MLSKIAGFIRPFSSNPPVTKPGVLIIPMNANKQAWTYQPGPNMPFGFEGNFRQG